MFLELGPYLYDDGDDDDFDESIGDDYHDDVAVEKMMMAIG